MKIEELEKLCDEATPGPWKYDLGNWSIERPHPNRCGIASMTPDDREWNPVASLVDGVFIVEARTYLPKLLAVAKAALETRPRHCRCETPCYDCSPEQLALSKALTALEAQE